MLLKPNTFWYESAFRPQESGESAHRNCICFKRSSGVDSFGSDGLVNSCGRLKPSIFKANYVTNSVQSSMKTFKSKMADNNVLFVTYWLTQRRVKRLRSEPRQRRFGVRSARTSAWWDNIRAGLAIQCARYIFNNNKKCRESKCKSL